MNNLTKLPATVFSGFLGSGKTTIISHLTDYLIAGGKKIAYLKNEIGSEDIDGVLFKGKHIETRELLNGCICCTLTGSFYHALTEVAETVKPDRILIEASGAADPSAIALLVSSHPLVYRDGVVSIIDVVNFQGYKNLSNTARLQAEFTDLIVFNKIEMADMAKKIAAVGYVRELNEFAPIVEAPDGILNPDLVFGLDSNELNTLLENKFKEGNNSKHLKKDNIQSVTITLKAAVSEEKLIAVLNSLPSCVVRVKGFVFNKKNEMKLVNKVGARTVISDVQGIGTQEAKLVFIGFGIEMQKNSISEKINSLK